MQIQVQQHSPDDNTSICYIFEKTAAARQKRISPLKIRKGLSNSNFACTDFYFFFPIKTQRIAHLLVY